MGVQMVFFSVFIAATLLQCASSQRGASRFFMLGQRPAPTARTFQPRESGENRLWTPTWTDKLKSDLLKSYDKYSRPTEHQNVTTVTLSLILLHVSLDYSKSEMALNCWLPMSWIDEKLKWNKTDYNGISSINIPQHEIWLPDILAYNSAHGNIIDYYGETSTIVKSDGSVLWVPPSRFTVVCTLDLTYWPYDQQSCQLRLGSWSYDGDSIDVQVDQTKSSFDELEISEWTVIDVSQKRFVQYYTHCPEPYVEIVFTYTVKKESPAFFYTIIFPAIVTMILTLSVFWLPPDAIEKFFLNGICAIISILFLIYFCTKLPIMVHTPLIVVFYSTVLGLMCLSFGIFIAMENLTKQKSHSTPVPKFLRSIIQSKLVQDFLHTPNYPPMPTLNGMSGPGRPRTSSLLHAAKVPTVTFSEHPNGERASPLPPGNNVTAPPKTPKISELDQWRTLAVLLHKLTFIIHILIYLNILIKCFY